MYWEKPVYPEATSSGPLKMNCQMNRNGRMAAQPGPAEGLAQVQVGASGAGHRRAEFAPHQAVAQRQARAQQPSEQALRPAHGADHQRDGDERPHADHVAHVERRGL